MLKYRRVRALSLVTQLRATSRPHRSAHPNLADTTPPSRTVLAHGTANRPGRGIPFTHVFRQWDGSLGIAGGMSVQVNAPIIGANMYREDLDKTKPEHVGAKVW